MLLHQHGRGVATRVAERFEATDLGAPFKVILNNAVTVSYDKATGDVLKYKIPDIDGLVFAVVMYRVLHPRKLFGGELKFIRKALGLKQKDVATKIEVSAEHLSRAEAGAVTLSAGDEKLFRMLAFMTAFKFHKMKSCEAKDKLEKAIDGLFDVMGQKSPPFVNINAPLELHFHRTIDRSGSDDGADDDGSWNGEPQLAAA